MEGVEDIPGVVLTEGLPGTGKLSPSISTPWTRAGTDIDVGAHSCPTRALRVYVMGERGARLEAANR